MKFTKIKLSEKNGVHLEWTTPAEKRPNDVVEHRLTGKDAPAPEFTEAMQAFKPEVVGLLELSEEYGEGLTVVGLSINYEEDGRKGLVVTCLKALDAFNAPLVLNTPHLREASDEEPGNYLPDGLLLLVRHAEQEAAAYVNGIRAQQSLFSDGVRKAAQEFRDNIPDGVSVTLSTPGSEGVTLHGRKR
jgi:hypothetical protein